MRRFKGLVILICMLSAVNLAACRDEGAATPTTGPTLTSGVLPATSTPAPTHPVATATPLPTTAVPATPTPTTPPVSKTTPAPTVPIGSKATFKPVQPPSFLLVPDAQFMAWQSEGSVQVSPSISPLVVWFDLDRCTCQTVDGKFEVSPVDPGLSGPLDVGLLVLSSGSGTSRSATLLRLVLTKTGEMWTLQPEGGLSPTPSALPVRELFRMVNPYCPLSVEASSDTSVLEEFDPTPWKYEARSPYRLRPDCIPALRTMLAAATTAGIKGAYVRDTFRSYAQQAALFDANVAKRIAGGMTREQAIARTQRGTAVPGTSEHHAGYTFDTLSVGASISSSFGLTAYGKWLAKNCWDYGFIIRYPDGKEPITTKVYEPWHVRYIGLPTSFVLRDGNGVLEEFHDYLNTHRYLAYQVAADGSSIAGRTFLYLRLEDAAALSLPDSLTASATTFLSNVGDGSYVIMIDPEEGLRAIA